MVQSVEPPFANAVLEWDAAGRPHSAQYGDIYFSSADVIGESTHVFLEGNALPARWRQLRDGPFTIGELGFGAGVNFLNTCRLWCAVAPAAATLHYVACELHPLSLPDMHRAHTLWPELQPCSAALLRCYPDHTPGVQQMALQCGGRNISLTLLYGAAQHMLDNTSGWQADAWYLDGFAPRLNPALWQTALLRRIAELSQPGATLATYSVAGAFRANLAAAGFSFAKSPGYATKRHMLRAWLTAPDTGNPGADANEIPQHPNLQEGTRGTVCVIGGGLAGCSTAYALAQTGWQVMLLERERTLASQASGNPQGIVHCKPGKTATPASRFNLHAFLHATRHYRALAATLGLAWHDCGMLQLATSEELASRFRQLATSGLYAPAVLRHLDAAQASALAGLALAWPALHFPDSGWLAPAELCALYLRHPGISVRLQTEVEALARADEGWRVSTSGAQGRREIAADKVILCNSADLHSFSQTRHLPVISNRGQVDVYPAAPASAIRLVLCGEGYILPAHQGVQSIGGSYFVAGQDSAACQRRSQAHLQQLERLSPALGSVLGGQTPAMQRLGTRCITPDRMPLVGSVDTPDGARRNVTEGLYINAGHGSHGLTRTPLCAALLASLLDGTPRPLPDDVVRLLSPERFGHYGSAEQVTLTCSAHAAQKA